MSHVVYFVKRPGSGRVSFSIQKRTVTGERRETTTVKSERVDALNRALKTGALDQTTVDAEVKKLCDELNFAAQREEKGVWVSSPGNQKLLGQYWEKNYAHKPISHAPARQRLQQAIELLGPHGLLDDAGKLQGVLKERCKGHPRRQRRAAMALNQMRKWFGALERIMPEKKSRPTFKYLRLAELKKVIAHVDALGDVPAETMRALYTVLFASGLRVGEAYALEASALTANKFLWVENQLDRDEVLRATKTNTHRRTILFKVGLEAFHTWVGADIKPMCRNSLARHLKRACRAAFPKQRDKWVCVHELRHSFAVHCAERGIEIGTIAKLLGNSVQVCEEYYLRFIPGNDVLQSAYQRTLR